MHLLLHLSFKKRRPCLTKQNNTSERSCRVPSDLSKAITHEALITCTHECTKNKMNTRTYCVYNQTRECFLSLSVTPADTTFSRLRGLIGRLKLKVDEGLWIVPSCGVHTVGVLFPLDLIYLNDNHQVIHLIEHFPRFRIAPLRTQASSVLELPTHTIYSSQTQPGDQLVICAVEEISNRFDNGGVAPLKGQTQRLDTALAKKTTNLEAGLYEVNGLEKR